MKLGLSFPSIVGGLALAALAALVACSRAEERRSPAASSGRQVPASNGEPRVERSVGAPAPPPAVAPCPQKPNILIITLDTLRYDATALDPASRNSTPFLRQLASSGVTFRNCYSTHDSTPPSHFSLFTGYVNGLHTDLDHPEASIAYQLRRIGYHSFAVVANGNLSQQAFSAAIPFQSYTNLHDEWLKMTATQKEVLSPPFDARLRVYGAPPTDWYRMMLYGSGERVLRHLRRRLASARAPFLGFVNLLDAHDPYVPDPRFYGRAKERRLRSNPPPSIRMRPLPEELEHPDAISDPVRREFIQKKIHQAGDRAWSVATDLDEASLRIYKLRYSAEVRELDRLVSRIFGMLDEKHLRDSTVVVVTSDHGESFGEQELITHSFADQGDRESTHHVPLLIVFPSCYRVAGATLRGVCSIADVTPTLYELLHVDASPLCKLAPPGEFGHSLLAEINLRQHVGEQDMVPEVKASTQNWHVVTPEDKGRLQEESVKRLRALGYLR